MPVFDRKCLSDTCGWATDFAWEKYDAPDPRCPRCGGATVRLWLKAPTVIPDTYTTPLVDDVMDRQTLTFHSRSERQAAMASRGLTERVRHATTGETDKSKHTTRWI